MLSDSEERCRRAAAETLSKIAAPEQALAHLLQAFGRETDDDVRKKMATIANNLDRQITSQKP